MLENSVNEPDRAPGETKFEMSSIPHLRKAYLKRIRKKCRRLYKKPCYEQRVWLKDFDNLDVRDKISFIHELLFRCDSESLKVINTTLSNLRKVDFISELPKDLALFLISKLEVKSLIYSSQVNHLWAALTNCEWVWKSAYEKLISENGGGLPIQTKLTNNSWKTLCVQEYAIITNWYSKRFLTRELLGHREEIITYIKLDGNRIISGSVDFTIKIWSTETGELIHNLEGHTGGVWSCYVEGNLVISGGTDQTIRIWDAQEGRCLHVLYGHTSTVRCLDASGDMLVSGGRDHTVRVWNILSGECLLLLRGHTQSVRCVQFDGKIVVSGSYDHTLRVWDPVSGRCLHVLTGHTNRVYSLQMKGSTIVSGSQDTTIRVWCAETGKCLSVLSGHSSLVGLLQLRGNLLLSGNADKSLRLWDVKTGQTLHVLNGHENAITCLWFDNVKIVSGAMDGSLRLWSVKTGECYGKLLQLEGGGIIWRVACSHSQIVVGASANNEASLRILDFAISPKKLAELKRGK